MTTILEIQNLKCGGCANTIYKKISGLQDIHDLAIDNKNSTVIFSHKHENTAKEVKHTLATIGYPVAGNKNALTTKAKSYVSCVIGRLIS